MAGFVQFRGSRSEVTRLAFQLAAIVSGREPDRQDVGRGFLLALGFAALSDIKAAFVTKARGGTDEMGIKWKKLSPEYLAYGRRFGSGEQARLKRGAGLGRAHQKAPGDKKGLLTASQLKQWRKLYVIHLQRFLLSEPEKAAKSHAAAVAWTVMKRRGARTKIGVFGQRDVEILRDTGVLLNSLSPGILSTGAGAIAYAKPPGDGGSDQIFETEPGAVIVGTNVEYAGRHQATRPFLPDEERPVPDVWWERWTRVANRAWLASVELFFKSAA
jgi:hypothetical protein